MKNYLGVVFANVEDASLNLEGIKYYNLFDPVDTVIDRIIKFYSENI